MKKNNVNNNQQQKTIATAAEDEQQAEDALLKKKIAVTIERFTDHFINKLRKLHPRQNIETICNYIIEMNAEINLYLDISETSYKYYVIYMSIAASSNKE